jgi:hypothetical protein
MADDDLEALPIWRPPPTSSIRNWERLRSPPVPGTEVPCLLCGKMFEMRPYVGAPDQSCGECFKTLRETARLHCAGCGALVAKLVPKKLDCGFEIRKGMSLRLDRCSLCDDGVTKSKVLEIRQWMEQKGKVLPARSMPGRTRYG